MRIGQAIRAVVVVAGVACLAPLARAQTTWHVDDNNCPGPGTGSVTDPFCRIQDAIGVAVDTGTVLVSPGTYSETINFIGKAIIVQSSAGAGVTTIDATGLNDSAVKCTSGEAASSVLDGFSITGGTGTDVGGGITRGGGMYNLGSSPTVTECMFTDNLASRGGGMYNESSSPTVTTCTFSNNDGSDFGGGMYNDNSHPTVSGTTFAANETSSSGGDGGGIYNTNASNPSVTGCVFSDNRAGAQYEEGGNGGGMCNVVGSSPTVAHCTFTANMASTYSDGGYGGGMYNADDSNAIVTDCVFRLNRAKYGGALGNSYSDPFVATTTFCENYAQNFGGGMRNLNSNPTVIDCTFVDNFGYHGGGIYSSPRDSIPTVINCIFASNSASSSVGEGGGMYAYASPVLINSVFAGNSAARGSGVYIGSGDPVVTNCTVANNVASIDGGGIYSRTGYSLTIDNSIFWGNEDSSGTGSFAQISHNTGEEAVVNYSLVQGGWYGAGGVGNLNADPLFLGGLSGTWTADATYDTVAGQTTLHDAGAGLSNGELVGKFINPDTAQALQSLVVANTATTITVWGDFAALGVTAAGYQINDYHLLAGSPCTDAADNDAVPPDTADLDDDGDSTEPTPVDLDGNPRFAGVVDMGAYELQNLPPDCDANGPYVAVCQGTTTDIVLSGSESGDPDGDPLTFAWTTNCPGAVFDNDTNETLTLTVDSVALCSLDCTVFLTVDDGNGGSDHCDATVIVEDTTVPILDDVPADVTIECDAIPPPAEVMATDNCDPEPIIEFDEIHTDGPCEDTYTLTRTWTATDSCGNWAQATQIVTVQDTADPVLSGVPADVTVECDSVPPLASPTATDNCDPSPIIDFEEVRTDGPCEDTYTLTRTWTATDDCGNSTSASQTITVEDTTDPVIGECPENIFIECAPSAGIKIEYDTPGADDNCDIDVTVTADVPSGSLFLAGIKPLTTEVTFTAEDNCGNTDLCSFDVTLVACGACCNFNGSCTDDVRHNNCFEDTPFTPNARTWFVDAACADVNCEEIPTVSEWGLIVMTLLGCTVGTIVYGRRRPRTA